MEGKLGSEAVVSERADGGARGSPDGAGREGVEKPRSLNTSMELSYGSVQPHLSPACFTSMNAIPSRFGLEPDFNPILTRLQPKPNPIKR